MKRIASILGMLASVAPAAASAQDTIRLSVDSAGAEANGSSGTQRGCVASESGVMLVVFSSLATNLVPKDGNNKQDIFLRNLAKGTTERIVLDAKGGEPDGDSFLPQITPDGRFVAFQSDAAVSSWAIRTAPGTCSSSTV
jgi:Tol biopolymer transport system component